MNALASEGVSVPMHTWAGPGGALLVLTNHGALLERAPVSGEWQRVGRHVDGDEAERLARKRGYDHVGVESAEGFVAPSTLALVESTEEGVTVAAAEKLSKEEVNENARQRNAYIERQLAEGKDLDETVAGAARRFGGKIHSVRGSYARYCAAVGKVSPWDELRAQEHARMEAVYAEIDERRAKGELLKDVSNEIAERIGRTPGGLRQTYSVWKASRPKPERPALAAVPEPVAVDLEVIGREPEPTTSAKVRSLLGVTAVKDEGDHAVEQLRDLQGELVSAMRATLQAIPDAKRIVELRIEELMGQLDDIEAEGKRIVAAAEALGIKL